ncbi:Mfa1 family fimbria major subunit [Bacteroides sp. 224]|uniref:Mfa1 family fimbria major subunit n=1 Tax=Bacteroides sp. 224 TaxID=2302936 RepID=UPI0013D548D1|nr:Mfa1 family fimbria major subunit [Bacteroides sp. 224]NDV66567.1 hypothetical protein [Bacteroides sp. 224]
MKMNFKYVMMACAISAMGFASCSDNENIEGSNELPSVVEGEKAFAQVNLKFEDTKTRANYAPATATPEEMKIYNGAIYVFNSNKVLQQVVEFDPSNTTLVDANGVYQCRFETTTGKHYFLAVANAPAFTIPLGTHIDAMDQYIQDINRTKFETYIDPKNALYTGAVKGDGFFMTSGVEMFDKTYSQIEYAELNVEAATEAEIIADVKDKKNFIDIYIGRAMAKVEAFVALEAKDKVVIDEAKANGTVVAAKFKYGVANNPDAMYFFPYFGGENMFQSPYHYLFNTTSMPDNYWPALHSTTDFPTPSGTSTNYVQPNYMNNNGELVNVADFKALADQTYLSCKPFYAVENSNKVPTYGNSTLLSIETVFIPSKLVTSVADGVPTTATNTAEVTFYRIRTKEVLAGEKSKYIDTFFFTNELDAQAYAEHAAGLNLKKEDYELMKYTNGFCYYIVPLEDTKKGHPECYDVVRNHYYEVMINSIIACGYNKPGGDEDTEKKDPLDPTNPFMHANIIVKNWVKIDQSEDLGPRS